MFLCNGFSDFRKRMSQTPFYENSQKEMQGLTNLRLLKLKETSNVLAVTCKV